MACAETHNMSYQSPIPLACAAASCRRSACRYLCSLSIMWNTATISLRIRRSYSTHTHTHAWELTHTHKQKRHMQTGACKNSHMMTCTHVFECISNKGQIFLCLCRQGGERKKHSYIPHVMFTEIKRKPASALVHTNTKQEQSLHESCVFFSV